MIRAEPFQKADQPVNRDGVLIEIAFEIDDIVKGDAGKVIRSSGVYTNAEDHEQKKQSAVDQWKRRLTWIKPSAEGVGPPS